MKKIFILVPLLILVAVSCTSVVNTSTSNGVAQQSTLKNYTNSSFSYSLDYPSGWTIQTGLTSEPSDDIAEISSSDKSINLTVAVYPDQMSAIYSLAQAVSTEHTQNSWDQISKNAHLTNGVYEYSVGKNYGKVLSYNNYYYVLTTANHDSQDIKNSISSFKFTK